MQRLEDKVNRNQVDTTLFVGKAYSAWTTVDECGRHGKCLGYFEKESDAKLAAHGNGWYGGDGAVCQEWIMRMLSGIYLLKQPEPVELGKNPEELRERIKKEALAKLSVTEKEILGIKDKS